jgi:organic hydroperoxide reductase OsmC/OhrA
MTTLAASPNRNGIDTELLREAVETVTRDPAKGATHWEVTTHWRGGTRSDSHVKRSVIGGEEIAKDFTIKVDEPLQLCGTNEYANPQEHLLASLNACMIVGYSACCAHEGIELEALRIETEGDIDLRGFLGIDPTAKPGYDQLRYTVYVKGSGTPEQFEKIHRTVMATSPNYFNVSTPTLLKSRLVLQGD